MSFAKPVFLPSAIPVLFFIKNKGEDSPLVNREEGSKGMGERGGGGLNPVLNTNFRNIDTSRALETFHATYFTRHGFLRENSKSHPPSVKFTRQYLFWA